MSTFQYDRMSGKCFIMDTRWKRGVLLKFAMYSRVLASTVTLTEELFTGQSCWACLQITFNKFIMFWFTFLICVLLCVIILNTDPLCLFNFKVTGIVGLLVVSWWACLVLQLDLKLFYMYRKWSKHNVTFIYFSHRFSCCTVYIHFELLLKFKTKCLNFSWKKLAENIVLWESSSILNLVKQYSLFKMFHVLILIFLLYWDKSYRDVFENCWMWHPS